jgi:hypothetical protein
MFTRVRYSYTEAHHGSPPCKAEQRESFLSPTPTLKQILDALKKQVLVGRTYLDTARGLLNADPVLLQTAPTFFGMAIDGSLELAQMAVARLYDTTRNTMSVPKMLKRAEQEAGTFQRGSGQEVRKAIAECRKIVVGLEPVIASIGERRNGWLAHLDPNTISDPNALAARAKLTPGDRRHRRAAGWQVGWPAYNSLPGTRSVADGPLGEKSPLHSLTGSTNMIEA